MGITFTQPPSAPNLTFGEETSVFRLGQTRQDESRLHSSINSSRSVVSGKLVFDGGILNNGTVPTGENSTCVVELVSEDTTISILQTQVPAGLQPGQSYSIQDSLVLSNLPKGIYRIQGHVDLGDQEVQQYAIDDVWLDESGGLFAFPDLIADSLSVNQDSIMFGDIVTLSGLTGNSGPLSFVGDYTVRIWVSEDADLSPDDSLISNFVVSGPLDQGAGIPFAVSWTVPGAHDDSLLFFLVEVDPADEHEESSELNLFPVPFWIGESFTSDLDELVEGPLSIFPNPSTGRIHIEYEADRPGQHLLKVYSLTGAAVATQTYHASAPGAQQVVFEGSHLPAGVYLFCLQTPEPRYAKVVILPD